MTIFRETSAPHGTQSDRSAGDRKRHNEKVKSAIKENLRGVISEEAIIGQSGDRKIKVPIKGIKEYRFIYGKNSPGAGEGQGDEMPGEVIPGGEEKDGRTGPGGSDPGEDIYETEVDLITLIEMMFEDLKLPDMERKKTQYIEEERNLKRKGHQIHGIPPRLDKRQSSIQRIKRKQTNKRVKKELEEKEKNQEQEEIIESEEERFRFRNEDLRYDRVKPVIKKHSNAVIFCIMDTSSSMDMTKKYLARSFYFLLYNFIKLKYQKTEVVFISHHTEAKEVTEEEFFHKGESGGTKISSGYRKALEIIEKRFNPDAWNVYAFHCSDGDNFSEDNEDAVKFAKELAKISNLFGYSEIKPQSSYSWSSMIEKFAPVSKEYEQFVIVKIHETEDVWKAIESLLKKEKIGE